LFLQNPDSIEWEVAPSVYFDTPRSGKGDTVVNINPYPGYIGKQDEIKFTLHQNINVVNISWRFPILQTAMWI